MAAHREPAGTSARVEKLDARQGSTIFAGVITNKIRNVFPSVLPQSAAAEPGGSELAQHSGIDATPKIQSSFFLGRDELVSTLEDYFESAGCSARRAALWGMGGVG